MTFRLYVDEVGNDDMEHTEDAIHRYLSLSGVAMDQDYTRDVAAPVLGAFKAEIFKHDPDRPIVLHRKDIMNRKGVFYVLNDKDTREKFDAGIIRYLADTKFTLITAVINKQRMLEQEHWKEKHPYHYLMRILVEKYVQWLERQNDTGDIMPERRRGRKDKELERAFAHVRIWGSDYVNAKRIKDAIPSKHLKFRSKDDNITGLQICDLVAHPSDQCVRRQEGEQIELGPFAQKIVPVLWNKKYDRSKSGTIKGYGTKYLP